jgi:hypothetical protein
MEARQVIEEILNKVFKWHRFPVSLKAEAVLLYFKGISLRAVREFLLHKGYEVSIETIRKWFHAVGRALGNKSYPLLLSLSHPHRPIQVLTINHPGVWGSKVDIFSLEFLVACNLLIFVISVWYLALWLR